MTQPSNRNDGGLSQAIAQFHSIVEMVAALRRANNNPDYADTLDDAQRAIEEDALSVEVRSDWRAVNSDDTAPTHYRILLCTGGPAVQITGELNQWCEPHTARIEYQDWFTPWTIWAPNNSHNVESILLDYARRFYFGEG